MLLLAATYSIWSIVGSFWAMKFFAINVVAATVMMLLMAVFGRVTLRGIFSAVTPLVAYFLYLFTTALWAQNPNLTLYHASLDSLNLLVFCLGFAVALNCSVFDSQRLFSGSIYMCCFVAAIHMAYRPLGEGRWGNGIAMVLGCAAPFIIAKAVRHGTWRSVSLAVITLSLVVLAQSKTGIIACAVVVPLSVALQMGNIKRVLRFAIVSALPVCAIAAALLSVDTIRVSAANTLVRITGVAIQIGSTELVAEKEDPNRVFEKTHGVQWFWDYLPWGVGHMNYSVLSSARLNYILAAHNAYLAWGIEGGIPLLLLGLYPIARFARRIRRVLRQKERSAEERAVVKACALSMLAVLIYGLAHQIHQYPPLFVLLGFIEGLGCRYGLQPRRARPVW
jgi:hypothetical protein